MKLGLSKKKKEVKKEVAQEGNGYLGIIVRGRDTKSQITEYEESGESGDDRLSNNKAGRSVPSGSDGSIDMAYEKDIQELLPNRPKKNKLPEKVGKTIMRRLLNYEFRNNGLLYLQDMLLI
jgi:hypothetical protein